MRKEGRSQSGDQAHHDKLELHDSEETLEESEEIAEVIELFPEHGLDLTA